jgi:ATP-dependent helicase/nuclease subunit B
MLRIYIEEWSYESVFGYLKTGFANVEQHDIDTLENYVLACGIRGGRWTRDDDWNMIPDEIAGNGGSTSETQYDLNRINLIRKTVTRPLNKFRNSVKGRRTVTEFCTALFTFLTDIAAFEKMEAARKEFISREELELANESSQVWNVIIELLDQASEILGNDTVNLERFYSILTAGFSEYSLGLIPPSLDEVLVGSIERSKNHNIKALFIIGANDGVFPAPAGEEGILSDSDRSKLRELGIELAQDTRSKAFEEQFLVYSALTSPASMLHISYPIADHEGRSLRPSSVISRIKKIFPGILERSNLFPDEGSILNDISVPAPTFNAIVAAYSSRKESDSPNDARDIAYSWLLNNQGWKERLDNALSGLAYTSLPEPVKRERAQNLYGMPVYTSVSRLENFSACPFSFFARYGLMQEKGRFTVLLLQIWAALCII